MEVKRTGIVLKPDASRVLYRPFDPAGQDRTARILARIMTLSEEQVTCEIEQVLEEFDDRHQKLRDYFLKRFEQVHHQLLTDQPLTENRKLLIGAYFTQEYSLESAALFNPSMVWHPDQSDLPQGSRRFILSLRATGEGHISSITFRTGVVHADGDIEITPPTRFVTAPEMVPNPRYEKNLFSRKLHELGLMNDFTDFIVLTLARSNYEMFYTSDQRFSERIIFPSAPAEINGIEDARFVEFCDDDDTTIYYATYTAYDGRVIWPHLLET